MSPTDAAIVDHWLIVKMLLGAYFAVASALAVWLLRRLVGSFDRMESKVINHDRRIIALETEHRIHHGAAAGRRAYDS